MYINKIDELIDNILDDFYSYIWKSKDIASIMKESNFVKFQKQTNDVLTNYIPTINIQEIQELVTNQDNVLNIVNILKRYIAYYFFMTIAYNYRHKKDTYINNLLEFSRNQGNFSFKITDFFNSENNSNLIVFYDVIKNSVVLIDSDSTKVSLLAKKHEFKKTVEFLNLIGSDVIEMLKLSTFKGNTKEQAHNIIKTIIIVELYNTSEKQSVYQILSEVEQEQGEFTFIDIVVPRSTRIDYSMIESLLTQDEIKKGLASDVYNFIEEYRKVSRFDPFIVDNNIIKMINKGIVVPICDDFLLYHKDTEKYESQQSSFGKLKKKEDTKIRYIINKIDNMAESYSPSLDKNKQLSEYIKKISYQPLIYRKAILVNNNEEIRIINKFKNMGRTTTENMDFYNDLMNIRKYPYINFKDFEKYGFSVQCTKNINVVRKTTFSTHMNSYGNVQLRTGSNDQFLNIVGFVIPTNDRPLECLKKSDFVDISTIKSKKKNVVSVNGLKNTVKFINSTLFNNKNFKSTVYWMFDNENDKIKTNEYRQVDKMSKQDITKIIVNNLYENVVDLVYDYIIKQMNTMKEISIQVGLNLSSIIQDKFIDIPDTNPRYNELEEFIYFMKASKITATYDKHEDEFPGLFGNIHKLKSYKSIATKSVTVVHIKDNIDDKKIKITSTDKDISRNIMCQHFITWDKIFAIRKKNPNKYSHLLYEFINKFIIENNDKDFICKSCGTQVNLKKYVIDSKYNNEEDRFETLSMAMDIPLEDIVEYEKFQLAIKNIDKIVATVASISNLPYYVGSYSVYKSRRKVVVKNVIDMLLAHNKNMKPLYKHRFEKIDSTYGINKNFTNLFVFELDNSIFSYSSQDKDFYKPIKHNNIVMYIIFFLLIELNDNQLLYMSGDKTCNYYLFDKYGFNMFQDLMIVINNKKDKRPIKNYKVLCYLIYYMSCFLIKYKMWYYEIKNKETNKRKLFPMLQRTIINTVVDIINSIMEIHARDGDKYYLYELTANKFYMKLNSLFKDTSVIESLHKGQQTRIKVNTNKERVIVSKNITQLQPDSGIVEPIMNIKEVNSGMRIVIDHDYNDYEIMIGINSYTNCADGQFHDWFWDKKSKKIKCGNCSISLESVSDNDKGINAIKKGIVQNRTKELLKQYCTNNNLQTLFKDTTRKCEPCNKCATNVTYKFTDNELNIVNKEIVIDREQTRQETDIDITVHNKKYFDLEDEQLKYIYNDLVHKSTDGKFIDKFIGNIQNIIGKDTLINGTHMQYDTYIMDHDYLGNNIVTPVQIKDIGSRVQTIKNHSHYNTDVLSIINHKPTKMEIFYDLATRNLLGYKEEGKDYIIIKTIRTIKTIYSFANTLRYLGFSKYNIELKKRVKSELDHNRYLKFDKVAGNLIADFMRQRLNNLKLIINNVFKLITQLKNKYISDDKFVNSVISNYGSKIKDLITEGTKTKAFEDIGIISDSIFFNQKDFKDANIDYNSEYMNINKLIRFDTSGKMLLYYFTNELTKLFELNTNKFVKENIVHFLIEVIGYLYKQYNVDDQMTVFDVRRFSYILASNRFIHDLEMKGHGIDVTVCKDKEETLSEEEVERRENEKLDDNEMFDSLDTEGDNFGDNDIEDGADLMSPID
jgi:hypothetical protein